MEYGSPECEAMYCKALCGKCPIISQCPDYVPTGEMWEAFEDEDDPEETLPF